MLLRFANQITRCLSALVLMLLASAYIKAQESYNTIPVSQNEAFIEISKHFSERTVDYYTFDLVQTNEHNEVVGGQTIEINPPVNSFIAVPLDSLVWSDGRGFINPTNDIAPSTKWYNSENKMVANTATLSLSPDMCNDTYQVVSISEDGELSRNEVDVFVPFGIKGVTPGGSISDKLTINMYETPINGYEITIASVSDGRVLFTKSLDINETIIDINVSDYNSGIYTILCTLYGEPVSTYKFYKK